MIFLSSLLTIGVMFGLYELFNADSSSNDTDPPPSPEPEPSLGLLGTDGEDTLEADAGDVRGLGGNDDLFLLGTAEGYGGDGDDDLTGAGSGDMFGDTGNDTLFAVGPVEEAFGGDGFDLLTMVGNGSIYGDAGNDTLGAQYGSMAYGGEGADSLLGALGAVLDGGDGDDTLASASTVDESGTVTLMGGNGNDVLSGGNQFTNTGFGSVDAVAAFGGAGTDIITLFGDSTADGGADQDLFTLYAESTATGGAGTDGFQIMQNDSPEVEDPEPQGVPAPVTITDFVPGVDRLQIEAGADENAVSIVETAQGTTITVPWANAASLSPGEPTFITIDLPGVSGLTLADIAFEGPAPSGTLNGTEGNDSLSSDMAAGIDRIFGLGGDDQISLAGRAEGYGGDGNDAVDAGGTATGYGGFGADALGGTEAATLFGGAGDDVITGNGFANGDDAPGPMALWGDEGDDTITAGTDFSDDTSAGADALVYGGAGNDAITLLGVSEAFGGVGSDSITLRSENTATGGMGDDTFTIAQNDPSDPGDTDPGNPAPIIITDFAIGADRLQIDASAQADGVTITETQQGTTIRVPWMQTSLLSANDPAFVIVQLAGVTGMTMADLEFLPA